MDMDFQSPFRPVVLLRYTTYIPKSKNFSSILRTVESILPSLWIKRRADASALPDTSARAQFDTIVLNLTNGESSI